MATFDMTSFGGGTSDSSGSMGGMSGGMGGMSGGMGGMSGGMGGSGGYPGSGYGGNAGGGNIEDMFASSPWGRLSEVGINSFADVFGSSGLGGSTSGGATGGGSPIGSGGAPSAGGESGGASNPSAGGESGGASNPFAGGGIGGGGASNPFAGGGIGGGASNPFAGGESGGASNPFAGGESGGASNPSADANSPEIAAIFNQSGLFNTEQDLSGNVEPNSTEQTEAVKDLTGKVTSGILELIASESSGGASQQNPVEGSDTITGAGQGDSNIGAGDQLLNAGASNNIPAGNADYSQVGDQLTEQLNSSIASQGFGAFENLALLIRGTVDSLVGFGGGFPGQSNTNMGSDMDMGTGMNMGGTGMNMGGTSMNMGTDVTGGLV